MRLNVCTKCIPEARLDGYAGMYAVTMVVMNPVADQDIPTQFVKWYTAQHEKVGKQNK